LSAGTGTTGKGTPVNLSTEFDIYGIYQDGVTYTTGGLDGKGYSYSANLLGPSRVENGVLFNFGPADQPDVVASNGQVITLPAGQYKALAIMGTGVNGNQLSQTLTVTYTDGTSSKFVQNFSDWFTPQKYPGEYEGVAMAYRNYENGTKDPRTFNLYTHLLLLNSAKKVQSITLPVNPSVMVLAATLYP
jgi:hypothetical protein